MGYAVSGNGLIHADHCHFLVAVTEPVDRLTALAGGRRFARCCADGRVAVIRRDGPAGTTQARLLEAGGNPLLFESVPE